jgi:sulfate transport system permease protein
MRSGLGRRLLGGGVIAYVAVLLIAPIAAIAWSALREGPAAFFHALAGSGGAFALLLSIGLAAVAVVVNTFFGVVIAWVLTRDNFRGRGLANAAVDLPFAISPVIVGFALILLFGPQGWFGGLVRALHVKIVFAVPGMALATIFVSLPFVVREVGLVLAESGHDQEDVAYTLGASPLRAFFRVTLPNIRWGLLYGILLTTARCLGEFGAVLVVSGGLAQVTETGTLFVFRSLEDRRDLGAYAMALALAGLSILLIAGMEVLKRRRSGERRDLPAARRPLRVA